MAELDNVLFNRYLSVFSIFILCIGASVESVRYFVRIYSLKQEGAELQLAIKELGKEERGYKTLLHGIRNSEAAAIESVARSMKYQRQSESVEYAW